MKSILAASIVTAVLASGAPAAFSQDTTAAPSSAARVSARHHHQERERAFRMPGERVEARLAYIRTALGITDEQRAQWDAYAGVMRTHAAQMDERIKARHARRGEQRGERQRPTLVERHERQRARFAAAAQRLDELIAVEKPLYAALSREQQRIADEVLAPRARGGHGGRGGFRHHHRASFARS